MNLADDLFQQGCAINRAKAQELLEDEKRRALFREILPELRRCIKDCRGRAGFIRSADLDELLDKLNQCEE